MQLVGCCMPLKVRAHNKHTTVGMWWARPCGPVVTLTGCMEAGMARPVARQMASPWLAGRGWVAPGCSWQTGVPVLGLPGADAQRPVLRASRGRSASCEQRVPLRSAAPDHASRRGGSRQRQRGAWPRGQGEILAGRGRAAAGLSSGLRAHVRRGAAGAPSAPRRAAPEARRPASAGTPAPLATPSAAA
eukprot:366476-Chlamydomonas_euryale.AAC.8